MYLYVMIYKIFTIWNVLFTEILVYKFHSQVYSPHIHHTSTNNLIIPYINMVTFGPIRGAMSTNNDEWGNIGVWGELGMTE